MSKVEKHFLLVESVDVLLKSWKGEHRSEDGFVHCLVGIQADADFDGFVGSCRSLTHHHVGDPRSGGR